MVLGELPVPGPGRVAQSVGHLTRKSGVLGSIPGLATYFRFSFRFFKGSCQFLAKVCARSTGLGGLSLPRKSVVRLTDRPDMTLDIYRRRKTTMQQQQIQCRGVLLVWTSCKTRAYRACSRCGRGLFGHIFYRLSYLSSFSLSLGDRSI